MAALTVVGAWYHVLLVPAEDEAPIEPYITEVASAPTPPLPPPSFLPTLIRPLHTRASMAQGELRATSDISFTTVLKGRHIWLLSWGGASVLLLLDSRIYYARKEDRAAVRAEIEILRRERLAYEQESIETRQALARTMATVNQGMSVEEIEQIVARRVANAIEAIAIYESINQTKQQENKVAGNASNKRKWESDHNGSSNQQHKGHKVFWAHAVGPNNKKYAGMWNLTCCTKCILHHKGQCAPKCNICKKIGHLAQNCRTPAAEYQRTLTCYECGGLGHYKRDCPELKNQNHGNQAGSMEARGVVHAFGGGETKQDLNNIEDEIEA
ncbi:reverse transcriptase domain-containing protein [Tanacetum coccineum]|uniref:Reverse transcriptase domain-containing protein n=1 Tax=Tanacetum coccineum TaxID=301880 RepID=A0ABQ4YK62_9ASTR